jgi:hypothetical protein
MESEDTLDTLLHMMERGNGSVSDELLRLIDQEDPSETESLAQAYSVWVVPSAILAGGLLRSKGEELSPQASELIKQTDQMEAALEEYFEAPDRETLLEAAGCWLSTRAASMRMMASVA